MNHLHLFKLDSLFVIYLCLFTAQHQCRVARKMVCRHHRDGFLQILCEWSFFSLTRQLTALTYDVPLLPWAARINV
jgi:hypothetical protein